MLGTTIYKNMTSKRDNSKTFKDSDFMPCEIVKETEKAVAIEDVVAAGYGLNSQTGASENQFVKKLTWIPKSSLVTVLENKLMIPYWIYS